MQCNEEEELTTAWIKNSPSLTLTSLLSPFNDLIPNIYANAITGANMSNKANATVAGCGSGNGMKENESTKERTLDGSGAFRNTNVATRLADK